MKASKFNLLLLSLIIGFLLISCKKNEESTEISDIDGNIYTSVKIGTQIWMVENLKTTRYNDGTSIPLITDNAAWKNSSSPAYCWYDNTISYKIPYGALYNWFAVNTGKLCPSGWHVPSDDEWKIITTYLGGESVAGGKLKETGTDHWESPNTGATNEYGFAALPGGYSYGSSFFIGSSGNWWCSSEYLTTNAVQRSIYYNLGDLYRGNAGKQLGFSVRCLKD